MTIIELVKIEGEQFAIITADGVRDVIPFDTFIEGGVYASLYEFSNRVEGG